MRYTRGSPIRPAVQYGGIYETAGGYLLRKGLLSDPKEVGRRSPNAPRQGRRPMPYPLRMEHPKEVDEASRRAAKV